MVRARRSVGLLFGLGLALSGTAACAGDSTAVYAWLTHEREKLPSGATIELVGIEETESLGAVFTVRYLPQGESATVTCQPMLGDGWICLVTRSVFVTREELVG